MNLWLNTKITIWMWNQFNVNKWQKHKSFKEISKITSHHWSSKSLKSEYHLHKCGTRTEFYLHQSHHSQISPTLMCLLNSFEGNVLSAIITLIQRLKRDQQRYKGGRSPIAIYLPPFPSLASKTAIRNSSVVVSLRCRVLPPPPTPSFALLSSLIPPPSLSASVPPWLSMEAPTRSTRRISLTPTSHNAPSKTAA